jgi:tetratricopeptide (TPR) repeat protein
MRFIEGKTLQVAINQFHEREITPERDLGEQRLVFRQLLTRFVSVCNTIAYAHSRGVVHRDLKPANIMLGNYGETLVVDWGLAKAVVGATPTSTNATGLQRDRSEESLECGSAGPDTPPTVAPSGTEMGLAMGTPSYMSPEQAAGEWNRVGSASDVYSLGATLYAILTGKPPFGGVDDLDKVMMGKVVPPRQVRSEVPAALDAICMKAMAAQPEARYASATALAADLEQWLADEPVKAWPEPWIHRMARWGRRHRTLVSGAAALLLASVVALVIGIVAVNNERRKTDQANSQILSEQEKTMAALEAESKRRRETRQALDALSSEVVEDLLAKQDQLTPKNKKLLEQAITFYQEFASDTGNDEPTRAAVAAAYHRVGFIQNLLGDLAGASEAFKSSDQLFAALAADYPAHTDHRRNQAKAKIQTGLVCRKMGDDDGAAAALQEAARLFRGLVAEAPTPVYRNELAAALANLSNLFERKRRYADAESPMREALKLWERLVEDFPQEPEYCVNLAKSEVNLSNLLQGTGRVPAAEEAAARGRDRLERLAGEYPDRRDYLRELGTAHNEIGRLFYNTKRPSQAETAYRDALAVRQKLVTQYPGIPSYRQELAATQYSVGLLLRGVNRLEEAEQFTRDSVALREELARLFPATPEYRLALANSYRSLGVLFHTSKRDDQAVGAMRQALDIYRRLVGEYPKVPSYREDFGTACNALAAVLDKAGKHDEARAAFVEATELFRQLVKESPDRSECQNQLAVTLTNLGRQFHERREFVQAVPYLTEAHGHHQRAVAANPRNASYQHALITNRSTFARVAVELGDHAAAAEAAEELARAAPDKPKEIYDAVCILARCVSLAELDTQASTRLNTELPRLYADRAMALLRTAVERGFNNPDKLRTDTNLDTLRQRADFEELMTQLRMK